MAKNLLLLRAILFFCFVAYVSSCKHAKYWKVKLPNVPLPKAVQSNLLHAHPDEMWKPRETVSTWWYKQNDQDKTNVAQPYTIGLQLHNNDNNDNNNMGNYSSVNSWYKSYNCSKAASDIINNNSNEKNKIDDEIGALLFFTEQRLRVGMKQMHDFQKNGKLGFLPRDVVESWSIPFGVDKLREILKLFSYNPNSVEAKAIEDTITTCEKEKSTTCTQSLEDIIDFVIEKLGTHNVKLNMMNQPEEEVPTGTHEYTITKVHKQEVPGNSVVACHRMTYPYAVHQCHHLKDMVLYLVTLVNPNGITVNTMAVCHYGPGAAWSPNFDIFRYLKVRPGEAPVCHFATINDMFWLLNNDVGLLSSVGEGKVIANLKIKLEVNE